MPASFAPSPFTEEAVAGRWDFEIFYANDPTVPVDITYELKDDGKVFSGTLEVGTFTLAGPLGSEDEITITLPAGSTVFTGTLASENSIDETVDRFGLPAPGARRSARRRWVRP